MECATSCFEPRWYIQDMPPKRVNANNENLSYIYRIIVYINDEDGIRMLYLVQLQQQLTGDKAQVELVDYGSTAVITNAAIRKFAAQFTYERASLI